MRYSDWILPLNVKNILKKFFKKEVPTISKVEEKIELNPLLERNKVLNNSVRENKTCYILACGPSINEMDLSFLKGEDCISVSNFFVHSLYNEIQPKYHVFAPTHEPITEEQYTSWIADFYQKTRFNTQLFLNTIDKKITDRVNESEEISRYYYELTDVMPDKFQDIKLDCPLPRIQTVVHIAIYVAIALGYQEIRLLGVDHDWLWNNFQSKHFYDEGESKLNNEGYKEYKGDNFLRPMFKNYLLVWDIYIGIKKYATTTQINIYNSTPNSKLDVFSFKIIKK